MVLRDNGALAVRMVTPKGKLNELWLVLTAKRNQMTEGIRAPAESLNDWHQQSDDPFGRFPILTVSLGTASGLLRCPAATTHLLCSRTVAVLAPPFRSPQKGSFLPGEQRPLAFAVWAARSNG